MSHRPYLLCGRCSRPCLSVDRHGVPVGLTRSAFGDIMPLYCPQCGVEHIEWTHSAPYDHRGRHVSGPVLVATAFEDETEITSPKSASQEDNLSTTQEDSLSEEVCIVCGLCSRRVLRVGADGRAVAFERSAYGKPLPLTCPSCGVAHTDWTFSHVKPLPL